MVNSEYGIFQLCKWLISLIYWYHLVNGMDPPGTLMFSCGPLGRIPTCFTVFPRFPSFLNRKPKVGRCKIVSLVSLN